MMIPTLRQSARTLEMWPVYDHPADFPNHIVARRFQYNQPQTGPEDLIKADSIQQIRELLASHGLVRIERAETDDPCIVETWL